MSAVCMKLTITYNQYLTFVQSRNVMTVASKHLYTLAAIMIDLSGKCISFDDAYKLFGNTYNFVRYVSYQA